MKPKLLKNANWTILISSVILLAIGMVALFSASKNTNYYEFQKQAMWLLVCVPVLIVTILFDYRKLIKFAYGFYIIILGLLVAVLFTQPINGASSWFNLAGFAFQPSEFAKIVLILCAAKIITRIQKNDNNNINKLTQLIKILIIMGIPIALIIKQPDYGTAMAFVVALVFILFVSGINKKYIIVSILIAVISLPLLYFFVLPEHAKSRIEIFLNPYQDPRGAGYNIIQSKLAIGAGEIFGMGLFKGNQTQLGYLYPKTTDFIFAVIGEELGFIVAASVVVLYLIIIIGGINIAKEANDKEGSYIAVGITGLFAFHMIENIGMTMGLLPITGVPLLFISYGGSALLTSFILIGLLINISMRKE